MRYVLDEAEAPRLLETLRALHDEVGVVPLDEAKALATIGALIRDGVVIVVEEGARTVATAGLDTAPYWYGQGLFLADLWCWVRPDRRDGAVAKLLLDEIARFADETEMHALVCLNNPNRRRLPKSRLEFIATALRYQPRGYVLTGGPA